MVSEISMDKGDELLEQAGLLVAEGDFMAALPVLEQIVASGDELQKEMAEAYLEQVNEMLSSEDDLSGWLTEDAEISAELSETPQVADTFENTSADVLLSESVADEIDEITEIAAVETLMDAGEIELHDELFAVAQTESIDESSMDKSPESDAEPLKDISDVESEIEPLAYVPKTSSTAIADMLGSLHQQYDEHDAAPPTAVVADIHDAIEVAPQTDSLQDEVPAVVADSEMACEIDLALEQVGLLLGDVDSETATLLLAKVFDSGSQKQKAEADKLLAKIAEQDKEEAEEQPTVKNTVDVIEATLPHVEQPADSSDAFTDTVEQNAEIFSDELLEQAAVLMSEGENAAAKEIFGRLSQSADEMQRDMANAYLSQLAELEQPKVLPADNNAVITDRLSVAEQDVEQALFADVEVDLANPLDALQMDADFITLNTEADSIESGDENEHRQGFHISNVGLMIRYIDGSELTDIPQLYYLPNAPTWFLGVVNLHGVIVPVFDLADYFGLEARVMKNPKLLVLGQDEKATGIIIDGLPQRLSWAAEQKVGLNMVPDELRSNIKAACLIEKGLWFDLDVSALMSDIEMSITQ